MTGKELLFEELRSRGLTESQIKSKAVAVLLDVIANDGTDRYLNAKEVDDELKEKKEALVSLQNSLKIRKWQNEEVLKSLRRRSDNLLKPIENKAPERAKPETGDWIRFDPYDRQTWPPDDPRTDFDTVLVCSEDDYIYIGYIYLVRTEPTTKFKWWLSNCSEDIQVPLDVVKAWQPLPKPFHM